MTTRILIFDPLNPSEVTKMETEIDGLLSDKWEIQSTVSHYHPSSKPKGAYTSGFVVPTEQSYLVMILHKPNPPKKLKATVQ